jgi:hypothetical protein
MDFLIFHRSKKEKIYSIVGLRRRHKFNIGIIVMRGTTEESLFER